MQRPDAILIAGPTASGKSDMAIQLAQEWGGEIVNTDSMQIYPVLDILTARPSADDLAKVPHHLYGYAPLEKPYSVARWLEDARQVAQELWSRDVVPVFVGGTGLYFKALEEGLAGTPNIPGDVRTEIRGRLIAEGSEALHAELARLDPVGANGLRPSDGQRIARALEVIVATGKSLSTFHAAQGEGGVLKDKNCQRIVLLPERSMTHERINKRTEIMLESGAIAEVETLLALDLPPEATVSKAIGVSQIEKLLHGEQSLNATKEAVKAATRQYAKRQSTWFRGQFGANWEFIDPFQR